MGPGHCSWCWGWNGSAGINTTPTADRAQLCGCFFLTYAFQAGRVKVTMETTTPSLALNDYEFNQLSTATPFLWFKNIFFLVLFILFFKHLIRSSSSLVGGGSVQGPRELTSRSGSCGFCAGSPTDLVCDWPGHCLSWQLSFSFCEMGVLPVATSEYDEDGVG